MPIKLWFILSLIAVAFINGCTTRSYVPKQPSSSQQRPMSYRSDQIVYHTVQQGETLANIGRRYGVSYQKIATLNGIYPPYMIYSGQSLQIPSGGRSIPYTEKSSSTYSPSKMTGQRTKKRTTRRTGKYHMVRKGETLYSIAKSYNKTYQQVAAWNNISSPYILSIGQRLRLTPPTTRRKRSSTYTRSKQSAKSKPARLTQRSKTNKPVSSSPSVRQKTKSVSHKTKSVSHIVQPGDTVYKVAQQYGYNIEKIAQWNGLKPPYTLSAGRRLRVAPLNFKKTALTTSTSSRRLTTPSYHTVSKGETLYHIAKTYDVDIAEIAKNNQLAPPYTLSPGQQLRLTSAKKKQATKQPFIKTSLKHNTGYHVVRRGDTLYRIANKYGYSVGQIANWNRLSPPYPLSTGQRLRVYPPSGVLNTMKRRSSNVFRTSASSGRTYTVKKGDTLYRIAQRYNKEVTEVARWNHLDPPYTLSPGQILQLFPAQTQQRTRLRYHIVKPGETLINIANQYGLSAYQLSLWNGIGSPYTLYPGQKLSLAKP